MATKSFLKDVEFKDKSLAQTFAESFVALSEGSPCQSNDNLELSRKCTELKGDGIKEFFNVK